MNEVLRQLGTISQCQTPTRLGGQIGERQKDARLRLSGTARRELKMKTGGPCAPVLFFPISTRVNPAMWGRMSLPHRDKSQSPEFYGRYRCKADICGQAVSAEPAANDPLRSFTPDNIGSVRSMGHQRAPSVPFAIKNKIAN